MSDRQVNELVGFLLVVRPDLVAAGNPAMLPREYCEEIRDRGFLVSWSPQEQVLCHPSAVAFLTHSRWNWNSTIESVCRGVPVIC
ncbi:hypothetical protein KPL71_020201 [Citrus sinensis]|uniref:Uncharacterized protein n=1 Tax=Citrus sinensis TaxID=2711 RepID=A0ACB8J5J1_CITSI|nr:hypothetical protein KPL71_020201 [Citrus sinensis]